MCLFFYFAVIFLLGKPCKYIIMDEVNCQGQEIILSMLSMLHLSGPFWAAGISIEKENALQSDQGSCSRVTETTRFRKAFREISCQPFPHYTIDSILLLLASIPAPYETQKSIIQWPIQSCPLPRNLTKPLGYPSISAWLIAAAGPLTSSHEAPRSTQSSQKIHPVLFRIIQRNRLKSFLVVFLAIWSLVHFILLYTYRYFPRWESASLSSVIRSKSVRLLSARLGDDVSRVEAKKNAF